MTSHRSRFLTSLGERLQSDLAARERERDDLTPPVWPETSGQTGGNGPWPEEIAGDDAVAGTPTDRAARVEAEQDATFEADGAPGASAPIEAFLRSEADLTSHPSVVPWSEAGMPVRLREAIASVRRVSHEMHEPPVDDYATHGPAPFGNDAEHSVYPLDRDAKYEEPPRDDRVARLEYRAGPEHEQIGQGGHTHEVGPPDDEFALLDERARFQHEQPLDDDVDYEESQAAAEWVLRDDGALDGDGQTRFGLHAGYEETPPHDAPLPLHGDPAYQHEEITLDADAADDEQPPLDKAPHALPGPDYGAGREPAPGGREDSGDRLPLWRRAKTRYGLHAAAFAVAIAFVALAGFGLGILSGDGRQVGASLTRDGVRAAPTEPGPPSSERNTPQAERQQPAGLSELVTVRVAPAPVAAVPEPAPPARLAPSAPPLPPPPKPAFRPMATSVPAPSDRQLAGVVEDAAAALLEAEEAEGAGGPFQPLFTKLPTARPTETRVFVHYSASAVGAPATAMHLVRRLKAEGFTAEARPVEFPIPTNSIRYFFDADRAQAEALRSSLEGQVPGGAAPTVMDFTSHEPRPRPGLIEVWLRA